MNNNQKLIIVVLFLSISTVFIFKHKQNNSSPPIPPQSFQQPEVQPVPPIKAPTFEDALNSISEAELAKNLEFLCDAATEGRMSGKKGNIIAADFVKKQYESYGLPTMYHKFKIDKINPGPKNEIGDDFTQNVYAWVEGSDPILKDEIVVIAGHLDHIGYGPKMSMARGKIAIHPGADDNASGTVALLEIAKAFSKLKPKRTIVFQSYSAEELGLIGSRYYCSNPLFPIDSPDIKAHIFMINLDMIGYLGKGKFLTNFNTGSGSVEITKLITELNQKYSFAKAITSTQGSSGSDHASFYNKGVPIAFMHTGMHNAYHTPDDTPDKLNYQGMEKITRYAFELAWKVANADSRPFFNYAGFQEMEYTNDHSHPNVKFKD
jgi:hypothetical protein